MTQKYTTVRQLIEELKGFDPDAVVVLSCDAEGNGYSPLYAMGECRYRPDMPWHGEVDHPDEPFEDADSVPAVGLWPGG